MSRKTKLSVRIISFFLMLCFLFVPLEASASQTLRKGSRSPQVTDLQRKLINAGYLRSAATGYYGDLTEQAVRNFQSRNGLKADGIAGPRTIDAINKLSVSSSTPTRSTSAAPSNQNYLVPWFTEASNVLAIGTVAEIYDIGTGKTFRIKRTYGHNHADVEPLTQKDTTVMKSVFGGKWTWDRRPVIVTVGNRKMAASLAGMPHAGVDSQPANRVVSSRSGGYGRGMNYDAVKDNNVCGHFDLHFLGSRTHGTNRVDARHQEMVRKAADWAKRRNF